MSAMRESEIDKTKADGGDADKRGKPKKVTVVIDDDEVQTLKDTTPRRLLLAAGLDPEQRRLVKIMGKHQTPYPNPDAELNVHEGEQFITVSTGGTPVS